MEFQRIFKIPNMQISSLIIIFAFILCLPNTVADNYTSLIYSNTSLIGGASIAMPGCPSKCGDLIVPYPFGIGVNATCSISPFFEINCDSSFDPPKAFLGNTEHEVLDISETNIRIKNQLARSCYDDEGETNVTVDIWIDLSGTPFSFSNENKLTVVGCDDVALLSRDAAGEWADFVSSCVAVCSKPGDLSYGFCSGIGCCEASIPKGLQSIYATMTSLNEHKYVNFTACGYVFLAEQNSYTFNVSDVTDSSLVSKITETVPFVIDWVISNKTCNQIRDSSEITCQGHSECVDSGPIPGGYRCNCSLGFQGNPYLSPGCQDIDECKSNPCHPTARCINLLGSFNCSCPFYYLGDGIMNSTGCNLLPPRRKYALYAGLLAGFASFFLLAVSFILYKMLKKRRIKQLKQSLFKRNGGLLLQQQISTHDSVLQKIRIFTSKELERATDRFNDSRILGRGGQGTVYKGMLPDGRIIAVKQSKLVNEHQLQEFINEVVILSQINHRNVVKLLACCLETEVPMLVYEFVPNGTLYHLIHDHDTGFPITWDLRLRIATEIANALAYLHYATSIPIYHRDMKTTNILLDEKYSAKLSDFGLSRSVGIEQTHLTTMVKGTFGYLDPEYFQTGKFTEKSDVYSFGVVLIELLTGQKPIATNTTEEEISLVTRFLLSMQDNRLKTILDSRIIEKGVTEEHIAVSNLAKRCLSFTGKRRPTIREVASELESIRTCENPSFCESNFQDVSCTGAESPRGHGILVLELRTDNSFSNSISKTVCTC